MVLQAVFLFQGTVEDNLLFARPDAAREQTEAAARAANAEELLAEGSVYRRMHEVYA